MSFTRSRRATMAALLATSTLMPVAAMAQEAAGASSDEIIVTAQKREESLQSVPMSIQAFGTEKLGQLQVKEFQDYVKFLPSVTIQTGGPGFSQVYFRAVASGENANHSTSQPTVGMYLVNSRSRPFRARSTSMSMICSALRRSPGRRARFTAPARWPARSSSSPTSPTPRAFMAS